MKLDKKAGVGNLHCKVCGQRFQTGINYLSAAVDVYSDWIDACENVAQEAAAEEAADRNFSDYATAKSSRKSAAGTSGGGAGEEAEDDGVYDDDY